MQCSPDGQKQIINYISLLVAKICFHIKSFIYPTECTTRLKFILKFYITTTGPLTQSHSAPRTARTPIELNNYAATRPH